MPTVQCAYCHKAVTRSPSQILATTYCSRACRTAAVRRECPYTPDELHDLHWRQGLGIEDIARRASQEQGWNPAATGKVVMRWFDEAGLTRLTAAQHLQRLHQAGHPAQNAIAARQRLAQLREQGLLAPPPTAQLHTPQTRKKAVATFHARRLDKKDTK